jgi:hypothetical protein
MDAPVWTTRSHGESADRIERGRKALDMASHAMMAALFLRQAIRSACRVQVDAHALLTDAHALLSESTLIQERASFPEDSLTYTELIARQVWQQALTPEHQEFLVHALPYTLARVVGGKATPYDMETAAGQLDLITLAMQSYTGQRLDGLALDR